MGRGEVARALKVMAHSFSKSAMDKIEKAGGTVEIIGKVKVENRSIAETARIEDKD